MEELLENIEKGMTSGRLTRKERKKVSGASYNYYAGRDMYDLRGPGNIFVLINEKTGKWRLFSKDNILTVSDDDINFKATGKKCPHYKMPDKTLHYGRLRLVDFFEKGFSALKWTIYPGNRPDGGRSEDGANFTGDRSEDRDKHNDEESAYCIVDTDLNIVVPFRPFKDVERALRRRRRQGGPS